MDIRITLSRPTAKAMDLFFAHYQARLTVCPLPAYSPDYHPIEYLWRNLKKRPTHNKYFPEFSELMSSVDAGLTYLVQHPAEVLRVFGLYRTKRSTTCPACSSPSMKRHAPCNRRINVNCKNCMLKSAA